MGDYTIAALDPGTWEDFAETAAAHNGVWGGCWCLSFHPEAAGRRTPEANRADKLARVRSGRTHAALVYAGGAVVGWCQFGSPEELPRIKHRREYTAGLTDLPDWRITCFFVARSHRRAGVAGAALAGALDLIAGLGGGLVESYPEDVSDRPVSASFLHNGTLAMFTDAGFEPVRRLGEHHWVVRAEVAGR